MIFFLAMELNVWSNSQLRDQIPAVPGKTNGGLKCKWDDFMWIDKSTNPYTISLQRFELKIITDSS